MALKGYKEKVRDILKDIERTRNDDGILVAHYIARYHSDLIRPDIDRDQSIKLSWFSKLPPFENIRRVRQIIQNDNGEFLPTDPEVRKARKIKELNFTNAEVREAKVA